MGAWSALVTLLALIPAAVLALPDPGRFSFSLNSTFEYGGVAKNVFNDTRLRIHIDCGGSAGGGGHRQKVRVGWVIRETQCWNEYALMDPNMYYSYYNDPGTGIYLKEYNISRANYVRYKEVEQECEGKITLPTLVVST